MDESSPDSEQKEIDNGQSKARATQPSADDEIRLTPEKSQEQEKDSSPDTKPPNLPQSGSEGAPSPTGETNVAENEPLCGAPETGEKPLINSDPASSSDKAQKDSQQTGEIASENPQSEKQTAAIAPSNQNKSQTDSDDHNQTKEAQVENVDLSVQQASPPVEKVDPSTATDNNTSQNKSKGDPMALDDKALQPPKDKDLGHELSKQHYGETPRFIYILAALATIGGFLFGYDIGIVAGSMLFIQPYFDLSTFWQEAIVSGTIAAAAIAALLSGWLTDKIGRKMTIMTSSLVFTVGGVLMGGAPTKEILLAGRVVAGLGVGLASVVVPVYVAEASPVQIRGRLVSFHQLLINTGIIASSLLAGGFSYVKPDGWRYMLGMAAVPGVLQFVGFLFMPESPRWLVGRGRTDEARRVLERMRGKDDVSEELNEIIFTVEDEQKGSVGGFQHLVKIFTTPQVRRALFVGCGLLFFQQWCGINTVIYYSGTVLKMAGFPVKYAIWLVTVPNLINFLSSFIGIGLVEKVGRRPLLICSLAGTLIGLIILAVGFQLSADNPASLNTALNETNTNGTLILTCTSKYTTCSACVRDKHCGYCFTNENDGTCLPSFDEERSSAGRCNASSSTEYFFKWAYEYCPSDFTWIALAGMAVFVFAFAPGLGPMPWTINSEIYPLWARSTCNSLAACTAWVCNLVISFTFLTMTEHITIHGTFWLFAAITVVGVIFMQIMLPETKNKTLEEMEKLFMTRQQRESLEASRNNPSTSPSEP